MIIGVGLFGCSKNQPTSTLTQLSEQEVSDIDPWLKSKKFSRELLTDPALYYYNKDATMTDPSVRSDLTAEEQKKIGKVANFTKSGKYNITGTVEIISPDSISIKSFSYNGGCGPLAIQLSMSNAPTKSLATIKTISTAISSENGNFDVAIPTNISLIQFNIINLVCPDNENPVSSASFN